MQQLYELNARTWASERAAELGRPATLDDLPDATLEHLAEHGFTWLYLMGVWPTGPLSRAASLADVSLRQYLVSVLPGANDDDIRGSPLAPAAYACDPELGGDAALERLRDRARSYGMSLMLDFIPNHTGLDHPWAAEHPDWFIRGDEATLARDPESWIRLHGHVFAHGRDPFFSPWRGSIQFDYSNPVVHDAMIRLAADIAGRCDGLRCDVAMLLLPDVFASTWRKQMPAFWKRCLDEVRALHPGTLFMAEVYWNREYELQQSGFDFTYDKILYDRLLSGDPDSIRAHLRAGLDYQGHCVRFIENHEEQRAAARFPNPDHHRGALFITGMVPGMLLCHSGQEDGRALHASLHARRRPPEAGSDAHRQAYRDLLRLLGEPARQDGTWHQVDSRGGSPVIGLMWSLQSHHNLLVAVNASWGPASCALDLGPLASRSCQLQDVFGRTPATTLEAQQLQEQGLRLELPAWGTAAYRILPWVKLPPCVAAQLIVYGRLPPTAIPCMPAGRTDSWALSPVALVLSGALPRLLTVTVVLAGVPMLVLMVSVDPAVGVEAYSGDRPAWQLSGQVLVIGGLPPLVSVQLSVPVVTVADDVQVRPRFCGVTVLPTNTNGWPVTAPKLPVPTTLPMLQLSTRVVALGPAPAPPVGVTAMVAVPGSPALTMPAKLIVIIGLGA